MINRVTYWQCAIFIPKGGLAALKAMGLDAFRARLACAVPFVSDRVAEIDQWDDVKLLTVKVDWLERWYRRGLLCIGDAAHAMSPIGGMGINLALQDAVAAARVLVPSRRRGGSLSMRHLASVQRRRHVATRLTQQLQVLLQERVVLRVLTVPRNASLTLPWPARRLLATRWFPRLIGHVIGMGFKPERPGHRFEPGM